MIENTIKKIVLRENIHTEVIEECMREIMDGKATPVQIATFLTALKMKGETVEEIYGLSKVMREKALKVNYEDVENIVDTCGTGGDGINSFNISSTAMFIAAGAGVKIAKHGNRSITSRSGAADVLESLGANIESTEDEVSDCIKKSGLGFMFAPKFHSSMKYAMPIRKELGFRTVFNILGPLTNPAGAKIQLLGVFDKNLVLTIVKVLQKLGLKSAMVVHGSDGMDEITLTGNTYVAELKDNKIKEYEINPQEFGFELCSIEDLKGGEVDENAKILRGILEGNESPKSDIAILNAAAAIYISGVAIDIQEGILKAENSIKSGKALDSLQKFIICTNNKSTHELDT